jgi:CheY-like chemotaxis protein
VRILIVNGLSESRLRLRNILSGAGYEVLEADSGEKALQIAPSILPDLILLTIVLSGITGLETALSLRESPELQGVAIVLLGHVPPILMEAEPLASIVDGFLNIDVATDELLATVSKLVRQRI